MVKSIYYKLNNAFIAVFNPKEMRVKLGNPIALAMPCVIIDIEVDRKVFYLASLSHHESCNTTRNLPRGVDGTVLMMKLALLLAKHLFPTFKKVEVQDNSDFNDNEVGKRIILSDYYMFSKGKTWYQFHLQELEFDLVNKDAAMIRDNVLNILTSFPSVQNKKKLKLLGCNVSSRLSIFDNFAKQKNVSQVNAYICMEAVITHYKLPSLSGKYWKGRMNEMNPFGILFDCKIIEEPKHLRAQWGGARTENEHIKNSLGYVKHGEEI